MPDAARAPLRLLVVMPSWVGDVVMATPTLRRLRDRFKGSFIGGLVRPGMDQLLAGTTFFDELHVERASGVMGPKFVAAKVRPRRYDTALLLTNSFSTALVVRLAGIPRRIGYDRDARGLLLTDRLEAPRRHEGGFAPVPAVNYYMNLAERFLLGTPGGATAPAMTPMELATTPEDERDAADLRARAGVPSTAQTALLNPGGNNPAKRWPPDRFAAVADHLVQRHNLTVLINGSPAEADLVASIAAACRIAKPVQLPGLGITLGTLKALTRRSHLMVTNDTGPRHIAAAFGVPLVSLFGPTDPRWTIIPARAGETVLTADPTLPETELAEDHPERCRIERIELSSVIGAVDRTLTTPATAPSPLTA
jgi:heptosyltransferase-2